MREGIRVKDMAVMLLSFSKIGTFTIGGGLAMLPLMEREFVEVRGWVTQEEIVDIFAVAQSLPGVIAINTSLCIGYKVGGVPGAFAAALGMILPSFFCILAIAVFFINMQNNTLLQKAFTGVRAGVTALILLAAIKLGKSILRNPPAWILGSLAFLALVVFNINAIPVIFACGLAGLVMGIIKIKAGKP
ncbi:MAG: chromate transporter [Spirochaetales bacterium]|jgi:chromate transporter|nr:chromate transporter [Spirochaetales bacterium]